jgi:Bacterial SH3 domain
MRSFWADEYERMNQVLRDVIGSPTQSLLREMEQYRQLLEPPGYGALRELQATVAETRRVNEGLASAFSAVVGHYEVLKSLEAINYSRELAVGLQSAIQAFKPPAVPFIESFHEQVRSAARSMEALRQFEGTFAGQLLELTHKMAEAPEDELEERVETLSEFLGAQLAESKHGSISLEGYVQIILALILYIYSMVGAEKLEDRVMRRLDTIEEQLKVIMPVEPVEGASDLRLVSAASLQVHSAPSESGQLLGEVTRNSLVRIVEERGEWARVEYFDFEKGRTNDGWMAREFLQEFPADFRQDRARPNKLDDRAARERFERHFGEVDLGYATGVDNEQIDADLAREYSSTHGEN